MSLRGGGAVCRSQQAHEDDHPQIIIEIVNKCENIRQQSENINRFHESKEIIEKEIQWLIKSNQIIYDLLHYQQNQDNKVLLNNIGLLKNNLITILEAIKYLIDLQIYLVIQLLNICNLFSRLILNFYINKTQYTLKQDDQIINEHLDFIYSFIEFRNDQFKNIIEYQIRLIRMCILNCSIQFQQSNPLNFIQQFLDYQTKNGTGFQSINTNEFSIQKYDLMKEEQLQFCIEESKSMLINHQANGAGINQLKQILNQIYVELVLSSDKWTIKLSWMKIICELLSYQPYISKTKYDQLLFQHQPAINWEQAINQKLIIPVDQKSQFGLIQNDDTNLNWEIFNKQMKTLEHLKSSLIKGYGSIPKLDDYIYQSEEFIYDQSDQSDQSRINKKLQFYDYIDCLPINQIQKEYETFSLKLLKCNNVFQGFLQDKFFNKDHQIQKFQQFSRQLFKEYKQLDYNTQILDLQLQNLSQSDGQIIQNEKFTKFFIYFIFQQLFSVLKEIRAVDDLNTHVQLFINMLSSINIELLSNHADEITLIQNQINNQNYNLDLILIFIENQSKQFYEDIQFNTNLYVKLIIQFQKQIQNYFKKDFRSLFLCHDLIDLIQNRGNEFKDRLQQIIFISQFYVRFKQHFYYFIQKNLKKLTEIDPISLNVKLNDLLYIDLQQICLEFEDFMITKNLLSDFYNQIKGQSNNDKIQQQLLILENFEILSYKIQEQLQIKKSLTIINIDLMQENFQQIKIKELKLELELMQNIEKLRNFSSTQEDEKQIQFLIKERIDLIQIYLKEINHNQELEQLLLREIESKQNKSFNR